MIPGTEEQTFALEVARLKLVFHTQRFAYGGRPETWAEVHRAERDLKLAERRELVRAGKLPGSSALPHAVEIGVHMVLVVPTNAEPCDDPEVVYDGVWHGELTASADRALEAVTGPQELWFNDEGEALLSFADDQDATMFVLALEGRRS